MFIYLLGLVQHKLLLLNCVYGIKSIGALILFGEVGINCYVEFFNNFN